MTTNRRKSRVGSPVVPPNSGAAAPHPITAAAEVGDGAGGSAGARAALEAEVRRLRENAEQRDLEIGRLSRKLERATDTLSFRLGFALIHSTKSWAHLKALPRVLVELQQDARARREGTQSRSTFALAARQLVRRTTLAGGPRVKAPPAVEVSPSATISAARASVTAPLVSRSEVVRLVSESEPGASSVPAVEANEPGASSAPVLEATSAVAEQRGAGAAPAHRRAIQPLGARHIRNLRVYLDRETMLAQLLPKGGVVAEMGVDRGDFSQSILDIADPRELHLIDPWSTRRYGDLKWGDVSSRFSAEVEAGRVSIHRGCSTEVMAGFPDGHFDWVYIDTTHAYELTMEELAISMRKVRGGGIIAGHDYVSGNVDKRLRYGVVEAVHEFCIEKKWEMVGLTHEPHRYLSFALRAMNE